MLSWYSLHEKERSEAIQRGEEVYASHDCTDCHLPAHVLAEKLRRAELSLVRIRRKPEALHQFLATDQRHESFRLMRQQDQEDLIQYLLSLVPP
ncbi:MAG: hypothetical protein NZL89_03355 [Leptospiraceae bacterium]|nr:hypothetical protein [Leptospiraceae bacterium]